MQGPSTGQFFSSEEAFLSEFSPAKVFEDKMIHKDDTVKIMRKNRQVETNMQKLISKKVNTLETMACTTGKTVPLL